MRRFLRFLRTELSPAKFTLLDGLVILAIVVTLVFLLLPAVHVHRSVQAGEIETHWSFVPPKRPDLPVTHDPKWTRNPIDAFVLARLESEGLHPAPEADRTTLIRRLSFDLIGLPPTPEDVEAFVNDHASNAYDKLVDRLLASPHHGERWAQHWLDLARYADSDGFEYDQARPDMWRYRDWVVSALNADLPYDRFIRLQLAGDEAETDDPQAFIATGFNRLYPDMVDQNDQGLRRQNALNDITETTGSVFLGLTIGCARCHDHKTDPIKQKDFYALQAFFTPAQFCDDVVIAGAAERIASESASRAWDQEIGRARAAIVRIEAPIRETIAAGPPSGLSDEAARAFSKADGDRNTEDVKLVYEATRADRRIKPDAIARALTADLRREWDGWKTRLDSLTKLPPTPLPRARGLDESPGTPPPTFLLRRGDFQSRGPEVAPAFPGMIAKGQSPMIAAQPTSSGRRSALVDWLVRPDHPLTSRVMINRLWQHHFGRGIVATPGDFGAMGEEPSHPELLDWLATELVSRGWSLKAMHRLIVTSATYRQSSLIDPAALKADPDNALLWRHARSRLDGETIRDAMLAASGKLNRASGGPCVFPELPKELMKLSGKGAIWPVSSREEDRNRRSLYVFLRRNLRYPLFEAFDKPDTNASCPKRAVTTIAPQSLSLLNGSLANDSARALADRVSREAGGDADRRIDRAYRLALGHSPDGEERRIAGEFLREGTLTDLCLALMNLNEFVYVD
ncbi:MAG: Protein of unknown function (DUF1553)/Protein of unknown function [Planctomycetota bacterium]|nr:Protein of unknown function (DUF1553)/Protein of unknown function [Planctomycetota bacterium]